VLKAAVETAAATAESGEVLAVEFDRWSETEKQAFLEYFSKISGAEG